METYANALLIAIPFFMVLLLFEVLYGTIVKKQTYTLLDTVASLASGLTNIIKDSIGLVLVLISYPFLVEKLAIFELQSELTVYIVAFIALDFASYWNHRLSHKINFFWNTHIIHHSSEEFNLACALRQPISNLLGYYALFLIPAAFFGIPDKVIALLAPIHLFAQFWYHTKHIGKMGWLEYIIVTPSQHRVHHAINDIYIDKNLAAIFCVWDRAFGTFQEELKEVPPVYGVLKPVQTYNPFLINFQHLWRLIVDAFKTKIWSAKFKIWFMPTGWRPKDVSIKFPQQIISDPYSLKKYHSGASKYLAYWSVFQLLSTLVLILFMFYNYTNIGNTNLIIYAFILFFGIYGFTSLMDRSIQGVIACGIYSSLGLYWIVSTGDWFGINTYISYGSILVGVFLILTLAIACYFYFTDKKNVDSSYTTA